MTCGFVPPEATTSTHGNAVIVLQPAYVQNGTKVYISKVTSN